MEPGNTHQLIIQEEKGERTFSLPEGEIHLGRASSNELQLREKSVSRVHCRIERDGDRVVVLMPEPAMRLASAVTGKNASKEPMAESCETRMSSSLDASRSSTGAAQDPAHAPPQLPSKARSPLCEGRYLLRSPRPR